HKIAPADVLDLSGLGNGSGNVDDRAERVDARRGANLFGIVHAILETDEQSVRRQKRFESQRSRNGIGGFYAKENDLGIVDGGDEPVDVALVVIEVRRDANVAFTQAGDDVLSAQFLVKFGGFFRRASGEAAVRTARGRVRGAGWNAAVLREALVHKFDQFV